MSENEGAAPDLLTHQELREYRSAFQEFAVALRSHAAAAMDLADKITATQELAKIRFDAHKKVQKQIAKIAKARGLDPDTISEIDMERGVIVLK